MPFFQEVSDASPFRQGDIISLAGNDVNQLATVWGVIVTADCDIAQRKMGPYFTYVSIITAREYVERIWARDELAKVFERHGCSAVEGIHVADKKRDLHVAPMSVQELFEWARADGAELVADSVGLVANQARTKIIEALRLLVLSIDDKDDDFLGRLKKCWTVQSKKIKEQHGSLANALNPRQMRSDVIFLPTLPAEKEVGFVVLLRDIRSIDETNLYTNKLDLRIQGEAAHAMYRIGRFNDVIRHAIAQRFANLFSRIGMSEAFELECEEAAALVVETLAQ